MQTFDFMTQTAKNMRHIILSMSSKHNDSHLDETHSTNIALQFYTRVSFSVSKQQYANQESLLSAVA